MKCPNCNIDLLMTERQGVEIDYCSQCRGVWLDRGELDKIIERSGAEYAQAPSVAPREVAQFDRAGGHQEGYREDSRGHQKHGQQGHKKKSNFLADMFEGFGD